MQLYFLFSLELIALDPLAFWFGLSLCAIPYDQKLKDDKTGKRPGNLNVFL